MTVPKSCCKAANSIVKRVLAVLAFLIVWPASQASAKDTAPEWLHQAALQVLPRHDADAVAVILLDDTETTVRPNGRIETLHRQAFRVLRPEARREFGDITIEYDSETKVSGLKAWTITSNGVELAVSDKEAVAHGLPDGMLYEDLTMVRLQFPEVNPGSIVGYEYVQQDRPYVYEDAWEFQQDVPVLQARFDLHLPPGWEYSAKWFNHSDQAPQTPGNNEYAWQVAEQDAIREEPDMPPAKSVSGWMGIKYVPGDAGLRAKSDVTWRDAGLWYNGLTQDRRASSAAIHQKVVELTSGITDPLLQIRAITDYMQRNIRYFGVEIGIGGYQPHPAAEVYTNQFGDCKDKATLLSTMLKEVGIDSYYVAVDAHREGVQPDYPTIRFNHMILAIKLPPGVSARNLYSSIDDPALGTLLIFDPTNSYVPFGYLPWYLQNTYGLVMGPDGGTLKLLPVAPPATNRLLRTAQLTLTNNGSLSGEVRELSWGDPAHEGRQQYLETQPSKRAEILENFLQNFLSNFVVTGASLGNLDKYDEALSVDYKFTAQDYAKMAGDDILVRPRVVGDKYTALLDLFAQNKPRQYGIEFNVATRQDDVFDITVPTGYQLDSSVPPVNLSCDFATYKSSLAMSNGVLHYSRTLEIQKVHVPADKLADIKDFLQKVAADQEMFVALKPVESQASAPKTAN
jgi:hypothetical protein